MFDASNSSLILSSSPPSSSAFNRQYHNSRYHPYNRISSSSSSPSYYRTNEFEKSCSFDHNDQNSIIQNYDHSAMFCDYNFTWTATPSSPLPVSCSSLDREMNLERQTVFGSNCEGTGRVEFLSLIFSFFFSSAENFFIHCKGLLIISNDVYQLIRKNAVGHNR